MTDFQKEVMELHRQGLSQREIAKRLGRSRRTIRCALQRAKRHNEAVNGALENFRLPTVEGVERIWFKSKGYTVQVGLKENQAQTSVEQIVEAFEALPPALPIPNPPLEEDALDQMVVYPLFDVHHGLLAHADVSGEDMDLSRSRERILNGLAKVMKATPNAYRGVVVNGGDFTHQTDDTNTTRRSGHKLDVAARNFVTVIDAIEIISTIIEMALRKHQLVDYYSVPGNHDPQNWETILIGLRERYRNNPRVNVHMHMTEFSAIEHGDVAIFVHHGDKRTPKDLCMFVAAEYSEVWGRTKYRMLMTGHLHHQKLEEFPGIVWMQMPAITVRDAYSAGGYKSHAFAYGLVFDTSSETGRVTIKL